MAALNKKALCHTTCTWLAKWGKIQKEEREIRERLPSFLSVMENMILVLLLSSAVAGAFDSVRIPLWLSLQILIIMTDLGGEIRWH